MRNNEDYLDSLLNNVTKKLSEFDEDFEQKKQMSDAYMTKKNLPPKTLKALETVRENQFLREFEKELSQEDTDDFLSEFEAELENDALEFERTKEAQSTENDAYMDEVDQLVSASQAEPQADDVDLLSDFDIQPGALDQADTLSEPGLSEDSFAGLSDEPEMDVPDMPDAYDHLTMEEEPQLGGLTDAVDTPPEGMEALESILQDIESGMPGEPVPDSAADDERIIPEDEKMDDESIMQLLNGLSGEDETLSDIGKMLEADEQSISLEDLSAEPENLTHAADLAESSQAVKAEKPKKKRHGFFAKLMDLLFGEDEDDQNSDQEIKEAGDLENISDENMEILRAMNGEMKEESQNQSSKKGKKGKKKKDKEEKKKEREEKKKEKKEKKEKAPREKKPKKEKKPKEKGPREKPLPRGPVIMIWLLALSMFAFMYIGSNLLTKSNALRAAERSFDQGDYVGSYEQFAGIKIGEREMQQYERAKVLAGVQTELNAYYSMMEVRKLDLALDCLVRALGRSDLHMAEAEEWGVEAQMKTLVSETTMQLQDQFDVTAEQARELYEIDDRDEYSLAIDAVLKGLGLK